MHQKTVNIKEFLMNRQVIWLSKRMQGSESKQILLIQYTSILLMFDKYNLGVFWPRTQEGISELKTNQIFLLQSYTCKGTINNSRLESLWERSKTGTYGAYCISTSIGLDTPRLHKYIQFLIHSTHVDIKCYHTQNTGDFIKIIVLKQTISNREKNSPL